MSPVQSQKSFFNESKYKRNTINQIGKNVEEESLSKRYLKNNKIYTNKAAMDIYHNEENNMQDTNSVNSSTDLNHV